MIKGEEKREEEKGGRKHYKPLKLIKKPRTLHTVKLQPHVKAHA